jgi:hypothetical protein
VSVGSIFKITKIVTDYAKRSGADLARLISPSLAIAGADLQSVPTYALFQNIPAPVRIKFVPASVK